MLGVGNPGEYELVIKWYYGEEKPPAPPVFRVFLPLITNQP